MQAQPSTTSTWNKKETSQFDDTLRKSFPALMSEQSSWGIEDILARGVNGLGSLYLYGLGRKATKL